MLNTKFRSALYINYNTHTHTHTGEQHHLELFYQLCVHTCVCFYRTLSLNVYVSFWHAQLSCRLKVTVIPVSSFTLIARQKKCDLRKRGIISFLHISSWMLEWFGHSVNLMAFCSCLHSVKFLAFAFSLDEESVRGKHKFAAGAT